MRTLLITAAAVLVAASVASAAAGKPALPAAAGTAPPSVAGAKAVEGPSAAVELKRMPPLSPREGLWRITPNGKVELHVQYFTIDAATGKYTYGGYGFLLALDAAVELKGTVSIDQDRTHWSFGAALASEPERTKWQSANTTSFGADGELDIEVGPGPRQLSSQPRLLMQVRYYAKDGKLVRTFGCVAGVSEAPRSDKAPAPPNEKDIQEALRLFAAEKADHAAVVLAAMDDEVKKLVEQLGAKEARDRSEAEKQLVELARKEDIRVLIKKYANYDDPEVRIRAQRVMEAAGPHPKGVTGDEGPAMTLEEAEKREMEAAANAKAAAERAAAERRRAAEKAAAEK
jgi:hypothetical protein